MYPAKFEIKDATESNTSVIYLDLLISHDKDDDSTSDLPLCQALRFQFPMLAHACKLTFRS